MTRRWQILGSYQFLCTERGSTSSRADFHTCTSHPRQRTIFADMHLLPYTGTRKKFVSMQRSDRNPNPSRIMMWAPWRIYRPNFIAIGVRHLNMFPRQICILLLFHIQRTVSDAPHHIGHNELCSNSRVVDLRPD